MLLNPTGNRTVTSIVLLLIEVTASIRSGVAMFDRSDKHLRCKDTAHKVRRLNVAVHVDKQRRTVHVVLGIDNADLLLLTPLQVGWLRGELRDAAFTASVWRVELAENREVNR